MVRLGLLAVVVGLVIWRLARPSPRGRVGVDDAGWRTRGLRIATIGFAVLYLAALVAIGVR